MAAAASTVCLASLWLLLPRTAFFNDGEVARHRPESKNDCPFSLATVCLAAGTNFRETGAATATIACEIYSDYECPHCAVFFSETLPLLMTRYVQSGKVKLVHRDFPLRQHRYAALAARYANAAGEAGQYEVVVRQIFRTQDAWSNNGDLDTAVAQVLPPVVMEKVRALVKNNPQLDESVKVDMAMGFQDHLTQTPSLVIVSKGKRHTIAPIPPFTVLSSYLDQLLAQQ